MLAQSAFQNSTKILHALLWINWLIFLQFIDKRTPAIFHKRMQGSVRHHYLLMGKVVCNMQLIPIIFSYLFESECHTEITARRILEKESSFRFCEPQQTCIVREKKLDLFIFLKQFQFPVSGSEDILCGGGYISYIHILCYTTLCLCVIRWLCASTLTFSVFFSSEK